MSKASPLNDEQAVDFLMSKAVIRNGTMGPFACIPGMSDVGGIGPWEKTEKAAFASLRSNVIANLTRLSKAWKARKGPMETEVAA